MESTPKQAPRKDRAAPPLPGSAGLGRSVAAGREMPQGLSHHPRPFQTEKLQNVSVVHASVLPVGRWGWKNYRQATGFSVVLSKVYLTLI